MPFIALAASLLFLGQSLQQPKTLYQQIVSQPDPNNGYEDYIRAAEMYRGSEAYRLMNWTPDQYEQMLEAKKVRLAGNGTAEDSGPWTADEEKMLEAAKQLDNNTYLSIYKQIAAKSDKVFDVLRVGNGKRVYDPRTELTPVTLFPELAYFKALAKLSVVDAYVKFANGDSRGATTDLIEGLTFSRKISGMTLISNLVGIASTSIILAGFEENLNRLSDGDCQRILKVIPPALNEPLSFVEAMRGEAKFAIGSVDFLLKDPKEALALSSDTGNETSHPEADFEKYVLNMTANEKEAFRRTFNEKMSNYYERIISVYKEPENKWLENRSGEQIAAPTTITNVDDAANMLASIVTPVHRQAAIAMVKSRTQLRLLQLHALVIDYRWNNRKLPEKLEQAVPPSLMTDPMSGEQFGFEAIQGGYKIYSHGVKETGRIELKYKRDPNAVTSDDDNKVPPPALAGKR